MATLRNRFSFEAQVRCILWLFGLMLFLLTALAMHLEEVQLSVQIIVLAISVLAWWLVQLVVLDKFIRPLQTLTNVVGALREEDYSFRARGARRGDALGDLALEINALASEMQTQRLATLESAALVSQVIESIDAPVLAFDRAAVLRLLNPAAAKLLHLALPSSLGRTAEELHLNGVLAMRDEQVIPLMRDDRPTQWVVRRTEFRQEGVPHTLILLSDVSAALREEERQAWQRLIRVMGHEINNSLTPIKSLAGSLRSLVRADFFNVADADRALEVIEDRAESLNRFLKAYREFSQLPSPVKRPVSIRMLVERVAALETRLGVVVIPGQDVTVSADADQLKQALINLVRNAADAARDAHRDSPAVELTWGLESSVVSIQVVDNGCGVTNPANLFVPFYTTKPDGTGIGLALARQIAEAHSGSLRLLNRPEGGAKAELRIPYSGPYSDEDRFSATFPETT